MFMADNVISITKAKTNFSDLVNHVVYDKEEVFISRYGKPVVKIVPLTQDERWEIWEQEAEEDIKAGRFHEYESIEELQSAIENRIRLKGLKQ
jgi:prevent-host-death family protein